MSREPALYLLDIQEACDKILRYTVEMAYEDFRDDSRTLEAVEMNFVIIGEAVKHLPLELCEKYPDVDWRGMAGCAMSWFINTLGFNIACSGALFAMKYPNS